MRMLSNGFDPERGPSTSARTLLLLVCGVAVGHAFYKGGVLAALLAMLVALLSKRRRLPFTSPDGRRSLRWLPPAVFVVWIASGCASSPGGVSLVAPLKAGVNLNTFSDLVVEVDGAELTPTDKDRISRLIVDTIRKQDPARFKDINAATPGPSTLHASVIITNYEKGNAFARFMLAGLGQIHINGQVVLENQDTRDTLGRYEVSKTFAWGGIYGVVTRIDDVEKGFASAVADLLVGKEGSIAARAQPGAVRSPERAGPVPPELVGFVGVWRGRAEFRMPSGSVPATLRIYAEEGALRWVLTRPRLVGNAEMTATGAGEVVGSEVTLAGRYDAASGPLANTAVRYSLNLNGTALTGSGAGSDNIVHQLSLERASSE